MFPDYPAGPNHQPVLGIPPDLRLHLEAALGTGRDWTNAGHSFGDYVMDKWPADDAIQNLFEPLYSLINQFNELRDDATDRSLTLAWLRIKYPDVIDFVPLSNRRDFIEGAYRKMFLEYRDNQWLPHGRW